MTLSTALRAALIKATDEVDQSQGQRFGIPTPTGGPAGPAPGATNSADPISTDPTNHIPGGPTPVEELKAKLTASIAAAKPAS